MWDIIIIVALCLAGLILAKLIFSCRTKEFELLFDTAQLLDKTFRETKMSQKEFSDLLQELNADNMLVSLKVFFWSPFRWTTKGCFKKGKYKRLMEVRKYIQTY